MTLRKLTIGSSVRYVPKSEQTREGKPSLTKSEGTQSISRGGKINTIKKITSDENFSQNNKKFVEDFAAGGFGILTK